MGQDVEQVASSLETLYGSGALSDEARSGLENIDEAAQQITAGLGEVSIGDELLLAVILVDDSTSVATNIPDIRWGHKLMLEALRAEPFEADVQVQTRALNRGILSPYRSLADAAPLNEQNYSGSRLVPETPLYMQSLLTLGTVMVKAQQEEERGVRVRTFSLILTDGEDNSSGEINALNVSALVADMLEFSTGHIVAGMGVGEKVDYRAVFRAMGIPERWIFTPGTSVRELRGVFQQIARALALAASSEVEFHQLAAGPPPSSS